jgi:tRNA(adenine34) deaminase
MKQNEADIKFMALALEEARAAMERKEVPIGAVVVIDGAVIGRGHNLKESSCDPTAHAEIVAIKAAAERQKSWRLSGATLYVTLEPCLMCMGAIIQARLARIVFASFDPKAGACGSLYDVSNDSRLNHSVEVASGVSDSESKVLLQRFFSALRQRNKKDK